MSKFLKQNDLFIQDRFMPIINKSGEDFNQNLNLPDKTER